MASAIGGTFHRYTSTVSESPFCADAFLATETTARPAALQLLTKRWHVSIGQISIPSTTESSLLLTSDPSSTSLLDRSSALSAIFGKIRSTKTQDPRCMF